MSVLPLWEVQESETPENCCGDFQIHVLKLGISKDLQL